METVLPWSARQAIEKEGRSLLLILLALLLAFLGGLVYGSFFEWTLHRFMMHRPFLFVTYPFKTHAITHHGTFGSGRTYHLRSEEHRHLVTMAWWNAPILFVANAPVGLLAAWLIGSWWIVPGFMAAVFLYYGLYEYLHWCMHVPVPRRIQSTRLFRWIDQHHRLHHLQPMRNLNVVLPIADFVFRTRLSRAPMQS
jgi:hypothetical protein